MPDEPIFEIPATSERLKLAFSAEFFCWQALSDFLVSLLARALVLMRPFV